MLPASSARWLTRLVTALLVSAALSNVALARPAARATAEEPAALASATQQWKALSADARHRQQRDRWLKTVSALERAAKGTRTPAMAATALMRAAQAAEELSLISRVRADVERAERLYQAVADRHPAGTLADDALLEAARLERERLDAPAEARRCLERAAALKGDRKGEAARLLAALGPVSEAGRKERRTSEKGVDGGAAASRADSELLRRATEDWQRLRADRVRRRLRQHWVTAVAQLETAGDRLSPTPVGAVGFMRAGKAAEELSRLSKRKQDAQRAVGLYLSAAERCPKSPLADDALLAAATIELNQLGDTRAARMHLAQATELHGDVLAEAQRMLRGLGPAPVMAASAQAQAEKAAPAAPPASAGDESARAAQGDTEEVGPMLAALEAAEAPAKQPLASSVRQLRTSALADSEWSLSEQVGLKVRRIIVDAGHGGHDTGAIGPSGVYEKTVTLAVAQQLAQTLRQRGYEVVLTRDSDTFLALEERTSLANRERGDLFISVHANAHKSRKMSGVETYSLNVASNRYAMRLAARENATTERSVSDLQFLLADFAMRANTVDSTRLARLVQHNVVQGVAKEFGRPSDLGVKHALFYVLLGARMPAVLVETAFLSNPGEEKKLSSADYQSALAKSIADGIDQFVARRVQLAALDD